MKKMIVGFFDSGIGGLSVLARARRTFKDAEFLYYADEKNVPYGEKTPAEILGYSEHAVDFLVNNGAVAIVVACNTATSVAITDLREKYEQNGIPIIGMEPAVKRALDYGSGGRILMAATPVTVRGNKMKTLIEKYDKDRLTDLLPLPQLVRFAENGEFTGKNVEDYIRAALSSFDLSEYSSLVLGCTHFNYFKDSFRKLLPGNVLLVDGIDGTLRRLASRTGIEFSEAGNTPSENVTFYSSGEKLSSDPDLDRVKKLLSRLDEMEKII